MNNLMNTVTTVVLTKNEAKQIPSLIENIKLFTDNILIIDSGSTDSTVEIAQSLGATVIYRAWTDSFAEQRNFALEYVTTPWIFYLDADERVTPELAKAIKKVVNQSILAVAYTMERRSVIFNKELRKGAMKPDFVPRLFPTKEITWVNKIHERPITNLPIKKLSGYLKHFTYTSWEQYWSKFNQYTTIWAENAYANGKKTSFSNALSHSLLGFFKMGLLNGGFFEGTLGCTFTYYHAVYTFTKYIKLLELIRTKGSTK